VLLDLALIGVVIALSRRQSEHGNLLAEMTEERRMISDLRASIKEELAEGQASLRDALERMTRLAAEADQEVRQGTELLTKEVDSIISQLASKFEDPMRELTRKQQYVETLLRKVETEKAIMQKVIARGEKLIQIFDKKIPYEEVISELEDKKYTDARFLLSRGIAPSQVARELGMSETEVKLVAGLSGT
jgi:hypothetical protein